ncbi:MAG: TolC family protein [Prevotella sp.]|nr:TolC family protein [Prevotella sp.]MBQ8453642.1 TolC family protein [Prevotella sp.]
MRKTISLLLSVLALAGLHAQTLDECQQAAMSNYPLIRRYDLIAQTADLTLQNLQTGWLPQLSVSAQATWQNRVVTLPDGMRQMLSQQGQEVKGLQKEQYRVGVDVQQTVYDGGAISLQRDVARRQADVDAAQNETELYQVAGRVNELYFGLLLIDDQIKLNTDLQTLLQSNEDKLSSMFRKGVAAESDYLSVKAERLHAAQQLVVLQSQRRAVGQSLALLCGWEQVNPVKPDQPAAEASSPTVVERPELKLFAMQEQLADARERMLDAQLRPRLSLFATGYYGYPGYDMYHDMFHRDLSFNAMIGARVQWNVGALYTRKSDKQRLEMQRQTIGVQRETFLFNNRLQWTQENEDIRRAEELMASDDEIIRLRQSVRQAAESKLAHGIIEISDLIKEINNENTARTQKSIHSIEWLKAVYDRKYTMGRMNRRESQ